MSIVISQEISLHAAYIQTASNIKTLSAIFCSLPMDIFSKYFATPEAVVRIIKALFDNIILEDNNDAEFI